jgi:hypothetical protein
VFRVDERRTIVSAENRKVVFPQKYKASRMIFALLNQKGGVGKTTLRL